MSHALRAIPGLPHLPEILSRLAINSPDRLIYEFADGAHPGELMSYRELYRNSAGVASILASVTSSGDRVLVLCPTTREFVIAFLACLQTGRIAVPAHVPFMRRIEGLVNIALDCSAVGAISTRSGGERIRPAFAADPRLCGVRWLYTDDAPLVDDCSMVTTDAYDTLFCSTRRAPPARHGV